jgi:hypothetical protein
MCKIKLFMPILKLQNGEIVKLYMLLHLVALPDK